MILNSGRRSNIVLEREMCDCKCEVFDRSGQMRKLEDPYERVRTGATHEFDASNDNLSNNDSVRLNKKISVTDIKRRKSKIEEEKLHPAVAELRHLLSTEAEERPIVMKKQQEKHTISRTVHYLNTADEVRSTVRENDAVSQVLPESRDFLTFTPNSFRPKYSVISKPSIELAQQLSPKLPIYPVSTQIKSQTVNLIKKASYSYVVKPNQQSYRQVKASQATTVQRPIMQQLTPRKQFQYQPITKCNTPAASRLVTFAAHDMDESSRNSVMTPQHKKNEMPKIIVPIETESQYEKTLRRNEQRSSKGYFKPGQMKFRNIQSVPGSQHYEQCDQDSIVVQHFTPSKPQTNFYADMHNRHSEPPIKNRQELEQMLARQAYAFQTCRNSPIREPRTAAKTQRPMTRNDFLS